VLDQRKPLCAASGLNWYGNDGAQSWIRDVRSWLDCTVSVGAFCRRKRRRFTLCIKFSDDGILIIIKLIMHKLPVAVIKTSRRTEISNLLSSSVLLKCTRPPDYPASPEAERSREKRYPSRCDNSSVMNAVLEARSSTN
jgi:hypothetical protein